MIVPGLFAGFIYAFIVSFGDVPVALFVTGGSRYVTMPVEIFQSLQFDFDPAILALSTLVVVFSAAATLLILVGVSSVGLSSGASVPEILVREVTDWLAQRGYSDLQEVTHTEERLTFALPRELRRELRADA